MKGKKHPLGAGDGTFKWLLSSFWLLMGFGGCRKEENEGVWQENVIIHIVLEGFIIPS